MRPCLHRFLAPAALWACALSSAGAQPAPAPTLQARMEALEAAMSDAFNRCDLDRLASFYAPALEFYHEGAGATWTRDQFIANVRKNACHRFTRHMVPGTLEASPLGSFGAVYTGRYQACAFDSGRCGVEGRVLMIVQHQGEDWIITRVVSYAHQDLPQPAP